MRRVRFHRAARADAEEAVRWYEERLKGLGEMFRLQLAACVHKIAARPLAWAVSSYDARARRYVMPRFPYLIVYMIDSADNIVVVAVAHAKRRPTYWHDRVKP